MRELRFRAWHEKLGRMFDDVCVDSNGTELLDDTGKAWWIGHEHIMQFTGLKDKNGKEIYEGDVVKFSGHYCGDFLEKECIEIVLWDESEASYPWKLTHTGFSDGPHWCEVIGNIYENPDLLV